MAVGLSRGWGPDLHSVSPSHSHVAPVLSKRSQQEPHVKEGTMSQFEVRARLKIREGQLEGFKRQRPR